MPAENQKQTFRRRRGEMESVSIRETITLSLPGSAVSCPDLEPISTQLWDQQLANNGYSHTQKPGYWGKSGESWETTVYILHHNLVTVNLCLNTASWKHEIMHIWGVLVTCIFGWSIWTDVAWEDTVFPFEPASSTFHFGWTVDLIISIQGYPAMFSIRRLTAITSRPTVSFLSHFILLVICLEVDFNQGYPLWSTHRSF